MTSPKKCSSPNIPIVATHCAQGAEPQSWQDKWLLLPSCSCSATRAITILTPTAAAAGKDLEKVASSKLKILLIFSVVSASLQSHWSVDKMELQGWYMRLSFFIITLPAFHARLPLPFCAQSSSLNSWWLLSIIHTRQRVGFSMRAPSHPSM